MLNNNDIHELLVQLGKEIIKFAFEKLKEKQNKSKR